MERQNQMDEKTDETTESKEGSQNIEQSIQYHPPWPKTADKHKRYGLTDGRTDGLTERPADEPSFTDAFLTDASKNNLWHNTRGADLTSQQT